MSYRLKYARNFFCLKEEIFRCLLIYPKLAGLQGNPSSIFLNNALDNAKKALYSKDKKIMKNSLKILKCIDYEKLRSLDNG